MNIVGLLSKVLPSSMKERLKSSAFFDCYIRYVNRNNYPISLDYLKAQEWIKNAKNMVDLGCGSSPHWKASVAVDKYIEPLHRKFGGNEKIDVSKMRSQGIKFIKADLENLPFKDNEFDLAYSHHVVEHLDNPALAMGEMMRIVKGGNYMSRNVG